MQLSDDDSTSMYNQTWRKKKREKRTSVPALINLSPPDSNSSQTTPMPARVATARMPLTMSQSRTVLSYEADVSVFDQELDHLQVAIAGSRVDWRTAVVVGRVGAVAEEDGRGCGHLLGYLHSSSYQPRILQIHCVRGFLLMSVVLISTALHRQRPPTHRHPEPSNPGCGQSPRFPLAAKTEHFHAAAENPVAFRLGRLLLRFSQHESELTT